MTEGATSVRLTQAVKPRDEWFPAQNNACGADSGMILAILLHNEREDNRMIARVWRGVTSDSEKADRYVEHVNMNVVPQLANIKGHINIKVLRRDLKDEVEVLVITTWESMDAIKGFAGTDLEKAVVEPQAIAVLKEYERTVRHFVIALDTP